MTQQELDAYARYLLMPLEHKEMDINSHSLPTLWLVSWRNPFTRETGPNRGGWTVLGSNGWLKNRFRSSWLESYRHFDREEFQERINTDEKFRTFLDLPSTKK